MAKKNNQKIPFFASLQVKYAFSYLIIFAVVLVLLNTYPILASQDLLFGSKRDGLKSQAAVMSSALIELETLSPEQVERVMTLLNITGFERVLVTDPAGLILYDSVRQEQEEGCRYALLQEVVLALRGYDVFHSAYENRCFISTAACPILYRGMTIGAIYLYEADQTQGELLLALQKNLRTISLVIAVLTLLMSAFFSRMLTARITALLRAIRIVGEGEYGHRLQPVGRDEMAHLAEEFNQLTDRLQATEEVRRRFVSDASHELKTPLASIQLLADSILQNQEMDRETVRDFVFDIGEEAGRLTRITEHLLALTRLDSLPKGNTVPVDVGQVARRTAGRLAPVADGEGVSFRLSLKAGCLIRCTPDDLYQICFNLMENAIKYNVSGGSVLVEVYPDQDQIILEVADTGVGIPEEDMPKVFNRFYRVDKARSRAAGGTGLGLSIVRDTVRRHGGWITVKANHPAGSVFTAGFPRYEPGPGEEGIG